MMKASTQGIEFTVAVVIYIFFVIGLIVMMLVYLQTINVDTSNVEPALRKVDVAHAAKNCLTERGEIKKNLLTEERVRKCGLGSYYIRVTNLETKEMWQHGYNKEGLEHTVFAAIEKDNGADPAEIYVKA
ncbi:MAG: hypothetical protein HYX24_01485 [Candidatus Aenigmarchaeota archaeon]|nr:hypothetical protein [Candidatus Aenigmarchaeota archaeon]